MALAGPGGVGVGFGAEFDGHTGAHVALLQPLRSAFGKLVRSDSSGSQTFGVLSTQFTPPCAPNVVLFHEYDDVCWDD